MKKISAILILVMASSGIFAQGHTQLLTQTWKTLALANGTSSSKGKLNFPSSLMELQGKTVELPGFMIPIKTAPQFSVFMLSMVPLYSCPYCGTGEVPPMIEVHLSETAVNDIADVINVRGRLVINAIDDGKSLFYLMQAKLIE
jgi:hypothetical protein